MANITYADVDLNDIELDNYEIEQILDENLEEIETKIMDGEFDNIVERRYSSMLTSGLVEPEVPSIEYMVEAVAADREITMEMLNRAILAAKFIINGNKGDL